MHPEIHRKEKEVNALQIEIDDTAVKLTALQQPVGTDVRFLFMASRIATELERIGDQAVNIVENAHHVLKAPPLKPLDQCRFGLVTSGGLYHTRCEQGFDQEGERRNPWWGDPSFRTIPLGTTEKDVRLYHLHIDPRFGEADLDVVLPMRRLAELASEGVVGRPAPTHYSVMGYILKPKELVETTAPAIAERMHAEHVDAAALVPA